LARDAAPVLFEPGTEMQYSNPGIAMLTYCVTALLRDAPIKDVRTLLRERIMRPTGVPDEQWSVGYGQTFAVDGLPLVGSWGGGRKGVDHLKFFGQQGLHQIICTVNINGGKDAEHPASFSDKGKTGGILFVDGTLYARLNMQDGKWPDVNHALAWSDDRGATWQRTSWVFPKGEGNVKPARFLNFGQDYAGVPSELAGYIYIYGFKQTGMGAGDSIYPLIKTRVLHWINFRWGFTGYLHWGFNQWRGADPFQDLEPPHGGSTFLPPGDAWIVYPGERQLLDSIRHEAMRDGVEDYELLTLLAQKDPTKAQTLAETVVRSFTDYVRDPKMLRQVRIELLESLD